MPNNKAPQVFTITLDVTEEDVRNLRRELSQVLAVVPTIAALIEELEGTTGISARSTVIGRDYPEGMK